jgi:hypothetical protein
VSVPLCISEFPIVQRHYPIVFAADDMTIMPMIITGIATAAFGKALKEADILQPRQADITFLDGRPHTVNGFLAVDEQAFQALPDETLTEWHRRGWLSLIAWHLSSQLNWKTLLDLHNLRTEPVAGAVEEP